MGLNKRTLANLLRSVVWPAAAGNVAWSFFTLAISEPWTPPVAARLITLVLLAGYLTLVWLRVQDNVDGQHFVMDLFHAGTLIVAALATHEGKPWVSEALAVVLVITIFAHALGIWKPDATRKERRQLAGANAVGLGILALAFCLEWQSPWVLPIAISVVLVIWGYIRRGAIKAKLFDA